MMMREGLHVAAQVVGNDSPAFASCTNNLAEVLRYQGHFQEASTLQQRAVELSEKVLGKVSCAMHC
jgi:hypothetical protein